MSFMTERKAKEVLRQYLQAEAAGNDTVAIQLERDLNNAGWFITSGPEGLTVAKKGNESNFPVVSDYLPRENTVAPTPRNDNPNRTMWIAIGITAAVITLTVVVIILVKRAQNAAGQQLPTGS